MAIWRNEVSDTKPEKDWPEDFSHENGMYYNRCCYCKELFIGYKRRVVCKECDSTMNKETEKEEYDVVIDVLQKHHDKLWDMSKNKEDWGIMDFIRLEQMKQLKEAMKMWKESK